MSNVESICGEYPANFVKKDIASDPNYVFANDPNYSARQLFDSEGNTVYVNSFIECEHYVDGGGGFTPIQNLEVTLHNYLFHRWTSSRFISSWCNAFRSNYYRIICSCFYDCWRWSMG